MKLLKVLGVAGVAGVAAGGVVVARQHRERAALTPDEVRERLRERHAQAPSAVLDPEPAPRRRWQRS